MDNLVRGAGLEMLANLITVAVMLPQCRCWSWGGAMPVLGAAGAGWGMVIGSLAERWSFHRDRAWRCKISLSPPLW